MVALSPMLVSASAVLTAPVPSRMRAMRVEDSMYTMSVAPAVVSTMPVAAQLSLILCAGKVTAPKSRTSPLLRLMFHAQLAVMMSTRFHPLRTMFEFDIPVSIAIGWLSVITAPEGNSVDSESGTILFTTCVPAHDCSGRSSV